MQLTDDWSDLIPEFTGELNRVLDTAQGIPIPLAGSFDELPANSNPVAPILEQSILNLVGYTADLITLNPAAILTQVQAHLTKLINDDPAFASYAGYVFMDAVFEGLLTGMVQVIFNVATNLTNPVGLLSALYEAPATFLDILISGVGESIIAALDIRNRIASDIDPPLPSWLSGLALASATPKATAAKTVRLNNAPPTDGSTPLTANTINTKTGTKLTAGTTSPAANSTPGGPKRSANIKTVLDKVIDLGLKPRNGKIAKK